jgi:hypothetical protein
MPISHRNGCSPKASTAKRKGRSFLLLFSKKKALACCRFPLATGFATRTKRKQALLFEKRSKNFCRFA